MRSFVARLLILLPLLLPLYAAGVHAQAVVQRVDVSQHQDGVTLDADIDFELNAQLREAAERGLPLYFSVDVIINRPRWWWFDEQVLSTERLWSISYNALIRQWRVSGGGLALPVASLDEALALVRHIRGWNIAPAGTLHPGEAYRGQMRLRLDVTQLSRPFQVNALNSSAWALTTPWLAFDIDVPADGGSP
ncbi:DUF4390 domain-containing protein [Verticiella sediminum]|uniref:DUF4390 domain-containing protein n=1 Tax=Verticiella sediminum TaxID=1247510 RepID=A0A556AMM9_9BURK|nr:DUF4390 domain-containing protein [Verticiella sediminum]TSH94144.1 DUF4390 domain-containing protein [Verticiella sediminum]